MDKNRKSTFGANPEHLKRLLTAIGLGESDSGEQSNQADSSAKTASNFMEQPGTRIGRYKLLSMLGEGGMGIVYLSEQQGSIRRRVALKVIKPGLDSKRVAARFEAERQALALLDHPNIAQVYDAGTTETGRPYFVMEYVKGLPITEYCDQHKLSIEDRLNLFKQVCLAFNHAHQKGIIHRDIKPSNILVTTNEDQAVPKIIDFGVAKAVIQPLTERTLYTELGQLFGTPEYMSPEQADMASGDIDTRSDIYSLGVLLYELLTGVLPFDPDTLRTGGIENIRKVIRETDPKTPSTRLTKLGEEAKKVAESRHTEVAALARCLQRELEWIPLKAMRKERSERYRSAAELADDIENYLKGDPLIAGPPSSVYRLKKFVRRHKALVTGIAAVLIVFVIGTIVSVYFALGKARAFEQQTEALAQNKAMGVFLNNDILKPLADESDEPPNIREVFDIAAEKIETRFAGYPLLIAEMLFKFGQICMYQFGDYDKAFSFLERSLEIHRREPDGNPYMTMNWLGLLYIQMGKYQEAEETFRELVKSLEELHEQGVRKPAGLYYAAKSHLGSVCQLLGRYDEVEPYIREAPLHPWWEKGHWREAVYVGRIAGLRRDQGRYDEAKQIFEDLLRASRKPFDLMKELGITYTFEGNLKKAEPLLEEALEGARKEFGEEHMNTVKIKVVLAVLRTKQGDYEEAELLFDQALRNMQSRLDYDHPVLLEAKSKLGVLRREQGRYDEAEKLLSDVIKGQSKKLGPDHPETLETMHELAILYIRQADYEKAEPLLRKAAEGRITKLKLQHPDTQESIRNLVELYEAWNKPDEAEYWRAQSSSMGK